LSEESEDEGSTERRSFRNGNLPSQDDQENASVESLKTIPSDEQKPLSGRGTTSRSRETSDPKHVESSQTDTRNKETSARSNRSQRSNSSSETVNDTRNGLQTLDRRTRLMRTSSGASKQPPSRRSLGGKEKSLRNLVSLLNSSTDCLQIDYGEDETVDVTVSSKGSGNYDSAVCLSEESEDEGTTERRSFRNGNPSNRTDQEHASIGSLNADPSDEQKPRSGRTVTSLSDRTAGRAQRDSRANLGENFKHTDNRSTGSQPSRRVPVRGLQKSASMRMRQVDVTDKQQHTEGRNVEEDVGDHVPIRGPQKASTSNLDSSCGDPKIPPSPSRNTRPIPHRGIQRSQSTRVRQPGRTVSLNAITTTELDYSLSTPSGSMKHDSSPDVALLSPAQGSRRSSGRPKTIQGVRSSQSPLREMALAVADSSTGGTSSTTSIRRPTSSSQCESPLRDGPARRGLPPMHRTRSAQSPLQRMVGSIQSTLTESNRDQLPSIPLPTEGQYPSRSSRSRRS